MPRRRYLPETPGSQMMLSAQGVADAPGGVVHHNRPGTQAYVRYPLSAAGMDGRILTILLTIVLPAILIGVTVEYFSSNPLAILGLFVVMIAGTFWLLSYSESF